MVGVFGYHKSRTNRREGSSSKEVPDGTLSGGWPTTGRRPYEYREYYGNEVEYIAWESTAVGSRRGFLLGFPAGALLTVAVIGGAVMTGLYAPPSPTAASERDSEGPRRKPRQRSWKPALREENQGLKKQVMQVKAAATCPPCKPQALATTQPPAQAVAAPPKPGVGPSDR